MHAYMDPREFDSYEKKRTLSSTAKKKKQHLEEGEIHSQFVVSLCCLRVSFVFFVFVFLIGTRTHDFWGIIDK